MAVLELQPVEGDPGESPSPPARSWIVPLTGIAALASLVTFTVLLVSLGSIHSFQASFYSIREGATSETVRDRLGEPTLVVPSFGQFSPFFHLTDNSVEGFEQWIYERPGLDGEVAFYTVYFRGGKVVHRRDDDL